MPAGVVFVSGSNGKSTTTHMLVAILRAHGLSVFTNPSGANLPQGIASAMLATVPLSGRLREDVAVLEVDEAFGPTLATVLRPHSVLLINVQVDQLNRFYEPDRVAGMLETVAQAADRQLVINGDDDVLRGIADRVASLGATRTEFAALPELLAAGPAWLAKGDNPALATAHERRPASVTVTDLEGTRAKLETAAGSVEIELPARGLHYAVDAAGATAMAAQLLGDAFRTDLVAQGMAAMEPVYGRSEVLTVGGEDVELLTMKNPPSLQVNLDYLEPHPEQVLVAVDEGTPDPSWIYASDLSRLDHVDIVTGTKSWQLVTRFLYGGIPVGRVIDDLDDALDAFLALPRPSRGRKTMILNYEQMMIIRAKLGFRGLEGER